MVAPDAGPGGDAEHAQRRSVREELGLLDEGLVRTVPPNMAAVAARNAASPEHVRGEPEPVAAQREPDQRGRAAQRIIARPPPRRRRRGRDVVAVVAQEQLLERGRGAGQGPHVELHQLLAARVELAGVDAEPGALAVDAHVVHPRQPAQRADRPAVSTSTVVRVRWRRSSNVPDSAARPARMMVTRSHSASTSERMWLDSSTVRPLAQLADDVLEDRLHQRVEARRRLVQEVELDVGGERRHQRDLLPVALRVGAALLRRIELEPLQQLGAASRIEAATQRCRAGRSPHRR